MTTDYENKINSVRTTFEEIVANHKMTIALELGYHRHLVFSESGRQYGDHWFELITYPYGLTINGDFGSFTFRTVEIDMFYFFMASQSQGKLQIKPDYWGEKITSESKFGGFRYISGKKISEFLTRCAENTLGYRELSEQDIVDLGDEIEATAEELDSTTYDAVINILLGWTWSNEDGTFCMDVEAEQIPDQRSLEDFYNSYLICLFCIIWGINHFNENVEKLTK